MAREKLREQLGQDYITSGVLLKWGYFLFGAFFLLMTLFTKGIRGMLAMSIIIVGSYIVIKKASSRSRPSSSWSRREFEHDGKLPLKKTSKILSKASRGSTVSRALLEERIREEILRKLRREKNLSEDDIEELIEQPEELFQVMDDWVLSEFVLYCRTRDDLIKDSSEETQGSPDPWLPRDQRSYRAKVADVIKRAKEWGG